MFSCQSSVVPDVMINTEVWIPPGYQYSNWVDSQLVDEAGTVSPHGRYQLSFQKFYHLTFTNIFDSLEVV